MGAGVSPAAPSVVLGHRGNWVSGADGGSVRRYGRRRENSPDLPRCPHRVHGGQARARSGPGGWLTLGCAFGVSSDGQGTARAKVSEALASQKVVVVLKHSYSTFYPVTSKC